MKRKTSRYFPNTTLTFFVIKNKTKTKKKKKKKKENKKKNKKKKKNNKTAIMPLSVVLVFRGKGNISVFSVCHCPSICPSHYLLINHRAEFNQTCYITFPHGWGVREQHYFSVCPSVRPSFIHLSVMLSPHKPLGGIQPNLLHHSPSW